MADTLDLDTPLNENSERPDNLLRAVKRELYGQGALIMFIPFRSLEDLYGPNDNNWWQAYLRHKPTLAENPKSIAVLGNMQNYYESFCRTGKNSTEPEFPNDVNQHRQQEEDAENEENAALDLLEGEQALQNAETNDSVQSIEDPLVSKLASFHDSLFTVKTIDSAASVTFQQAKAAVNLLPPKNKKKGFSLPGRARVNFETPETQED